MRAAAAGQCRRAAGAPPAPAPARPASAGGTGGSPPPSSELRVDPVHHRAQLLALALDPVVLLLGPHALEVLLARLVLGDPLAREVPGLDLAQDLLHRLAGLVARAHQFGHAAAQDGLLAEQVGLGLVLEGGLDHAGPGAADALGVAE